MRAFAMLERAGVVAAANPGNWTSLLNRFSAGKFHTFSGVRYLISSTQSQLAFNQAAGEAQDIRGLVVSSENSHVYEVKVWKKSGSEWEKIGHSSVPRVRGETLDSLYRNVVEEISRNIADASNIKIEPDDHTEERTRYLKSLQTVQVKIAGLDKNVIDIDIDSDRLPEFRKRIADLVREFGSR